MLDDYQKCQEEKQNRSPATGFEPMIPSALDKEKKTVP
jgi:hypothetical protein